MKTINHKGKTLHHHAPTGFYIDLATMREFVRAKRESKTGFSEMMLVLKRATEAVADEKSETGKRLTSVDLPDIWVFSEAYHFGAGDRIGFNNDKSIQIGKKHYFQLPHIGECLIRMDDEYLLKNNSFPVSACYSPARIMLENAK